MKKVLSYVRPGHINRKFVIVSGKDCEDISNKKLNKIGKWHFSRYEARLDQFYPYTGKNNFINIINNNLQGQKQM